LYVRRLQYFFQSSNNVITCSQGNEVRGEREKEKKGEKRRKGKGEREKEKGKRRKGKGEREKEKGKRRKGKGKRRIGERG
jgi:hypothetical protein